MATEEDDPTFIKFPKLPRWHHWVPQQKMVVNADLSEIGNGGPPVFEMQMGLKLSIWRKIGPFKREIAVGEWVMLPTDSAQAQEDLIRMSCDVLLLQLPGKVHSDMIGDESNF